MDTAEASAVIVNGRFCGAPNTASGGYVAGLLGKHLSGPARVSLEAPIPVDQPLALEQLADGGVVLSNGATALAHAVPAALQLEPPAPVSYGEAEWASERY